MARAKHTYAVRLAVEGGNRVKADLVSVGTSGERSIKKIDRASDKASRGLGTLGDRASSLRRNMRLLGGAVAGIAAGGGIALLINRSIAAADAVGKTADKLGVGTAAAGTALRGPVGRHRANHPGHGPAAVHPARCRSCQGYG